MESKQEVFEEVLDAFDEAVSGQPGSLHPTAQLASYSDRYADASDETEAQRGCEFCHGPFPLWGSSVDGGTAMLKQTGVYWWLITSENWETAEIPVAFCPMCGRFLGGDEE